MRYSRGPLPEHDNVIQNDAECLSSDSENIDTDDDTDCDGITDSSSADSDSSEIMYVAE